MIGDVLGIAKPLVLAPMGFVSGGALAAAVSRAGGLGLIGGGYGDADWIRREFKQAEGAHVASVSSPGASPSSPNCSTWRSAISLAR
jgi:NAD(P)H-dependent flavin oxidoreductase YrpB (nitropropane dioxygenase family)